MQVGKISWSGASADELPAAAIDPKEAVELAAFADDNQVEPDDFTLAESLCPGCGELLAWHDEFANCHSAGAGASPALLAEEAEYSQEPAALRALPRGAGTTAAAGSQSHFAYELGRPVQPMPALAAEVIWRGQLKERHPATSLVHRVSVYRLNAGYRDWLPRGGPAGGLGYELPLLRR